MVRVQVYPGRLLGHWGAVKYRLYRAAMGDGVAISTAGEALERQVTEELELSLTGLVYYLWQKGGLSLLRGSLHRWRLRACGRRFFLGKDVTLLYPSYLSVGDNVAIGAHSYLNCLSKRGVVFGNNVRLKEYVWLQCTAHLTNIGEGAVLGDNVYIGPHCILGAGGFLCIGNNVTLGAHVDLLAENHRFDDVNRPINQQGVTRRGITIEDDCWIGNRVIVLDGVTIGRGSVIGAGAVVTKDVPPYSVAAGNPARVLRQRGSA